MLKRNAALELRAECENVDLNVEVDLGAKRLWLDAELDEPEFLETICRWYQQSLSETPAACEYLRHRGLADASLWERVGIGYVDRKLGCQLPPKQSPAGRVLRERLAQLGIYRPSGHAHFVGSLTLPVRSAEGTILELYGRRIGRKLKLGGDPRKRQALHLYRCTEPMLAELLWLPHSGPPPDEPLVLTDSPLNALSFCVAGLPAVAGLLHHSGAALRDSSLSRLAATGGAVLVAFRNTPAGVERAERVLAQLRSAGVSSQPLLLPLGLDANDTLTRHGPERLATLVHEALPGAAPHKEPAVVDVSLALAKTSVREEEEEEFEEVVDESLDDLTITLGDRQYRVRGLAENQSLMRMKVNLRVVSGGRFHVERLDLCSAHQRRAFLREAAAELELPEWELKHDLGQLLARLETLQERQIRRRLRIESAPAPALSAEARQAALELLADRDLLGRISADLADCGLVGEEANRQLVYLATISRLLPQPVAVLIQSSSAAGKTTLMDTVLGLVPDEAQLRLSMLTGQSLYYMERSGLRHKVLAIAEEEGLEQASYALKLLQSEGVLRIATTGKDAHHGRQQTQQYEVEGPVQLLLTTTRQQPDEELQNRCLTLHVNESAEQTAAIHQFQRRQYTGAASAAQLQRQAIVQRHHAAQRLLEPQRVIIPGVEQLSFRHDQPRMRREHGKYLTLVAACALLHQYQRERTTDAAGNSCLLAAPEDVREVNRLLETALGRTRAELLPQTLALLEQIDRFVTAQARGGRRSEVRFTQRELREALGWGDFSLRKHLARLVQLEYVLPWRSGRGSQLHYELLYDGQRDPRTPFLLGLFEPPE